MLTIALAVLVHLGILAAVVGPVLRDVGEGDVNGSIR